MCHGLSVIQAAILHTTNNEQLETILSKDSSIMRPDYWMICLNKVDDNMNYLMCICYFSLVYSNDSFIHSFMYSFMQSNLHRPTHIPAHTVSYTDLHTNAHVRVHARASVYMYILC